MLTPSLLFLLFIFIAIVPFICWGAEPETHTQEPNNAQLSLPFCTICKCKLIDDDDSIEIDCSGNMKDQLFNISYWINATTNQTYPNRYLAVENSAIITLNQKFPKSDLNVLQLANNSIFNISDNVFCNLQKMEVLILSFNNLEVLHPDAFKGLYTDGDLMPLRSLKTLQLDHNKIHSLNGDIFEHTSRIEKLSLSHNPLTILDQQTVIAITSLVYLKELDLSYTQLNNLPDYFLHSPKYISKLDLSGNLFESIPKSLRDSHNLTELRFDNNPIVNLTKDNGFPAIPTLKILQLCGMQKLQNISAQSLSNLIGLEELHIADNIELFHLDRAALSDRHNDDEYESWPLMKKLHIQNNKLTYLDMHFLAKWEGLNDLDVSDNPWTCECENQWMIDELMPIYLTINRDRAIALKCAAPIEMIDFTFFKLFEKHSDMRCLDMYGHRPERDAALLVGILAGVLIAIPLVLFVIYAYQRHWFGVFDGSPAGFTRQFYRRTETNDEYF